MDAETSPPPSSSGHGGRDLTTGPIMPTLLAFALPTLGSNVLQSLNASVNALWVGRFLGESALAATSNANLVMFLAFSAVFGFGLAATILIGQAMGRRDVAAARRTIGTAVASFAMLSTVVAAIGWIATPAILRALATPPSALPLATAYLRVMLVGMPFSFLVVVLGMGLRGVGDSLTPFVLMVLNVALDAGLNPVLILGLGPAPRLGIAGSGTATALAGAVTLAALIAAIYARDLPIRLRGAEWRYLRPDPAIVRTVVRKGVPIGMQMFVISGAALAVIGLVNRAGIETTAAYGITQQLWTYIQMPALAVSAAVSAMAAQNIGAGRWERVDAINRAGILANLALTGTLIGVLLLLDRALLGLFLPPDGAAAAIGRHINLVSIWAFLPFGVTMVIFGTVRANGAVVAPLVIFAVSLFPVRLGLAFALMPRFGVEAIWWSMPVSSLTALAMAAAYYRASGWRRQSIAVSGGPAEAREETVADALSGGGGKPSC